MLWPICAIVFGFVGLVWSADRFVAGAAATAQSYGMSPMLIGLTIVALGTSAPEILVAIDASLSNAPNLAIGNAIGSNLANIGLVLGITALCVPIPIAAKVLHREIPLFLFATVLGGFCLLDFQLNFWDGLIFLLALFFVLYYLIYSKAHPKEGASEEEESPEDIDTMSRTRALLSLAIGLIVLIACSDLLVWGAKEIALAMGVSQLIIGLTVIAVGTSLPELAASITSAFKGHHDIALGNILGSNILNILAVLSVPALIASPALAENVLKRDYAAMTLITLLLTAMLYTANKRHPGRAHLGRVAAIILLLFYCLYYYQLFMQNP